MKHKPTYETFLEKRKYMVNYFKIWFLKSFTFVLFTLVTFTFEKLYGYNYLTNGNDEIIQALT